MANHQIRADQIRPGQNIIVRGQIEYIRVRSLMGPEDIDKLNQARTKSRYKLDRNKPLTRLALYNAEVVPQSPDGQMTPEEYYVWERMFESSDKPELGKRWNIDNKGDKLPILLSVVDGRAKQITDKDVPPSSMSIPTEPKRDQLISVILNVYPSGMGNNGIGIKTIIFHGKPEWFESNTSVDQSALAALGITLDGPVVAQTGVVVNEAPTQDATVAPVASVAPVTPAVQPAAPVATVQAPVAAPVQQVAAPVAPVVAPTVPTVPAAQQAAPQNTVVDVTSGLAMPAPVTQAVAPTPVTAPTAPVVAQAAPNPLAAQVLNAVAQAQVPAQVQTGSAFGTTPEAQPVAPAVPETPEATTVDSPWSI